MEIEKLDKVKMSKYIIDNFSELHEDTIFNEWFKTKMKEALIVVLKEEFS